MSINDLMADKSLIPFLLIATVIGLIVAIPMWMRFVNKSTNSLFGEEEIGELEEEKNVKVLEKRVNSFQGIKGATYNTVVFEMENGNRVELGIKSQDVFSVMIEGDVGTLKYRGKKIESYERNK